jgi:hypothetical protein
MIIDIKSSPVANKRLRAEIQTTTGIRYVDFGFRGNGRNGFTFVDGATDTQKENYWKRHLANETENTLIKNLVPSASLLSAYILWGETRDIGKNVKRLNQLWRLKSVPLNSKGVHS